jgi:hypothetical protein
MKEKKKPIPFEDKQKQKPEYEGMNKAQIDHLKRMKKLEA